MVQPRQQSWPSRCYRERWYQELGGESEAGGEPRSQGSTAMVLFYSRWLTDRRLCKYAHRGLAWLKVPTYGPPNAQRHASMPLRQAGPGATWTAFKPLRQSVAHPVCVRYRSSFFACRCH